MEQYTFRRVVLLERFPVIQSLTSIYLLGLKGCSSHGITYDVELGLVTAGVRVSLRARAGVSDRQAIGAVACR